MATHSTVHSSKPYQTQPERYGTKYSFHTILKLLPFFLHELSSNPDKATVSITSLVTVLL